MKPSEAQFRALYDAHVDFVWRCLRRLGIRESDLLDVTQKVFMTAFVKLPEFEGRSLLSSWLFAICQRVASDYRRSAPIRREVATDAAAFDRFQGDVVDELLQRGDAHKRASVAESILLKLPEPQRIVFVLFELEEMSGEQIATLLDVSVGTVRSRLRIARATFRREVKRLSLLRSGINARNTKEAG